MVIKGQSRGGPKQLANHLLRTDTNERVQILELHSPIGELHGAFSDWQLLSEGTRGTKGLYHANIDPAKGYDMTTEQWIRSVDVLEEQLGLTGQPRAIVLHEKNGREHIHVVWQRTNIDEMKLIHDGFNYLAHEKASYQLEEEFGHEHVPGKHAKRDREKQPEFPKQQLTHEEWQQKERTGVDPRDRKAEISALYEASDNAKAFQAALDDAGYVLAKGDRRDFVIVDEYGHAASLSRQLPGVPAKERREFMAEVDRTSLPTAEEARVLQRERAEKLPPDKEPQQQKETPPDAPSETEEEKRFREALAARQAQETQKLIDEQKQVTDAARDKLDADIRKKMDRLAEKHAQERRAVEDKQTAEKSILTTMDRKLRPQVAAERDRVEREAREALTQKQRDQRQDQVSRLRQARDAELNGIIQEQQKAVAELKTRHAQEAARYRAERAEAERLARELEIERQRQEELARSRDGPGRAR